MLGKHSTGGGIIRLKNQTKWSIYFGELGEMLLTAVLASISITRIIFDGGTVPLILILILIQIQYMPLGAFSFLKGHLPPLPSSKYA